MPSEPAPPKAPASRAKLILWQRPMVVVLLAAIPPAAAAVYFFGWRVLLMLAVSALAAAVTEWVFLRKTGKPVTSAVFVTSTLLVLTLPPSLPLWMVVVGAVVAVAFGKMMFGGFARNAFNPALVGRCFLYICFPVQMTSSFWLPPDGSWRALKSWALPYDALTAATPLNLWRDLARDYHYDAASLYLGNIGGSAGETCAVAIALGALILLLTRTANWRLVVGTLLGALAASSIGFFLGVRRVPDPVFTLGAGGLLFAAVYMVTDPVSAARTRLGQWLSSVGVGVLTVILRSFSIFAGGVMFAVLLMNTFSPLFDLAGARKSAAKPAKETDS
ncbi:MAG: RnfABCDGE type electron transport complex subunit D [Planctomycetota bacterium]